MKKKRLQSKQLGLFGDQDSIAKVTPPLDTDLDKALIRKATLAAFSNALKHYRLKPVDPPEINFSLRGRCAGQASWKARKTVLGRKLDLKLRFNLEAYRQDPADMLEDTIFHEVAHLVVAMKYKTKRSPHGPEWQAVMRDCFGIEPKRTHGLDLAPARKVARDFVYVCKCREHHLTSIRHNRMVAKKAKYRCVACGEVLVFSENKRT